MGWSCVSEDCGGSCILWVLEHPQKTTSTYFLFCLVSYPARCSFSFLLGPLHWSSNVQRTQQYSYALYFSIYMKLPMNTLFYFDGFWHQEFKKYHMTGFGSLHHLHYLKYTAYTAKTIVTVFTFQGSNMKAFGNSGSIEVKCLKIDKTLIGNRQSWWRRMDGRPELRMSLGAIFPMLVVLYRTELMTCIK